MEPTTPTKHVVLPRGFNFGTGRIPLDAVTVKFDSYFDAPIPPGALPETVRHIDFGWYFNQPVTDDVLPERVRTLIFGHWFKQPLELSPRALKRITVRPSYQRVVPDALLPLMDLEYQSRYKQLCRLAVPRETYLRLPETVVLPPRPNARELLVEAAYVQAAVRWSLFECSADIDDDRGTVVVQISHSGWEASDFIYVGRGRVYYRTRWWHMYIPKPRTPSLETTITGPLTLEQLLEDVQSCAT